jgi:hypothetical protein
MEIAANTLPVLLVSFIASVAVVLFSVGNFKITKSSVDNGGGVSAVGTFLQLKRSVNLTHAPRFHPLVAFCLQMRTGPWPMKCYS